MLPARFPPLCWKCFRRYIIIFGSNWSLIRKMPKMRWVMISVDIRFQFFPMLLVWFPQSMSHSAVFHLLKGIPFQNLKSCRVHRNHDRPKSPNSTLSVNFSRFSNTISSKQPLDFYWGLNQPRCNFGKSLDDKILSFFHSTELWYVAKSITATCNNFSKLNTFQSRIIHLIFKASFDQNWSRCLLTALFRRESFGKVAFSFVVCIWTLTGQKIRTTLFFFENRIYVSAGILSKCCDVF